MNHSQAILLIISLLLTVACTPGFRVSSQNMDSQDRSAHTEGSTVDTSGIEAYKTTVYAFVRQNCTACHESIQTPKFATANIKESFEIAQTLVNFNSPELSKFVERAENGHCGVSNCMGNGNIMLDAIKAWNALWRQSKQGPTVQWASIALSTTESSATLRVKLISDFPPSKDLSIPFTIDGTAKNPQDHALGTSGMIVLPALKSQAEFDIALMNDAIYEVNSQITLTLQQVAGLNLGANQTLTVSIVDDDPTPSVQFISASQTLLENAELANLEIHLSSLSQQDVIIPYTVSGSAEHPSDHLLMNGSVTIPAMRQSTLLKFNVVNDTAFEGNENVIVALGQPTGGTLGEVTSHTVQIQDDDAPSTLQFQTVAQTTTEGTATVTVRVELIGTSTLPISVDYNIGGTSVAPADHNLLNGSLDFPVGTTVQNITFSAATDTLFEGDETIIVTLATPTNAMLGTKTMHTITVKDSASEPTIQFNVATQKISESVGQAFVSLSLSGSTTKDVSVPVTVSGTASGGS